MRSIYESLLSDADIERALLLKIADEGNVTVTPEPPASEDVWDIADPNNPWDCCIPRVTVEWRGLVATVLDWDVENGPQSYKSETDYLDNWDEDTAQYHSHVPIRAAAGEIVDMIRANHLRALGLRSED